METEEIDVKIIKEFNIKNICHVGAHIGNEIKFYADSDIKKVVWVESNLKVLNSLIKNTYSWNIENFYLPLTLSDVNDQLVIFNITNNEESSSFMDMGDLHINTYPHVNVVSKEIVLTKRFDTYVNQQSDFIWDEIEMIVTDCQGADLKVLRGFGNLLYSKNLRVIKSEINFGEMYKDNPTENDIDEYLTKFGFVKKYWFIVYNGTWGNTYWVR